MRVKLVLFPVLCLVLLVPAIASAEANSGGIRLGQGRLLPSTAALVGLLGVVIGRRALARSANRSAAHVGTGKGRAGAIVALVIGAIVMVVGGLHTVFSAGGFGTGNGLAGAIVAMGVGLISMVMGGVALPRTWRSS
jgi:Family of unknown function (DUF6223)